MTLHFADNYAVTHAEFWRAVGEELRNIRFRKGWNTVADVERAGGPTGKTLANQEKGVVANIQSLEQHCEALGVSLVAVFRTLLVRDQKLEPLSAEQWTLVELFARMAREDQETLLRVAGMAQQPPAPAPAPSSPSSATPHTVAPETGAHTAPDDPPTHPPTTPEPRRRDKDKP
jgi:transcriptional regulator with XRE-family HTH domain